MVASTLVLTVLFFSGAFLVAAPAYVFGGRADHAAIALLVYAMATIGLIEAVPMPGSSTSAMAAIEGSAPAGMIAFEPLLSER